MTRHQADPDQTFEAVSFGDRTVAWAERAITLDLAINDLGATVERKTRE
jgi:hypothetical protein